MKTLLALALALATTACGQLSQLDSSLLSSHSKAKSQTVAVDVLINAPIAPEPTPSTTREPPAGTWAYSSLTCDFDTRLCDEGSVVGFDSVGPIVMSSSGERTLTSWADWTQVP
jgi:hypothetical protein